MNLAVINANVKHCGSYVRAVVRGALKPYLTIVDI